MSGRVLAMVIGGLAAGALIVTFLLTHERVEIDTYLPPQGEASLNPLLAAERFLRELGYNATSEVEFVPSYELPDSGDTAVLLFDYRGLQSVDLEILLNWVALGGHLVVEIQPKYGRAYDPIFTPLGIGVTQADSPATIPNNISDDLNLEGADDDPESDAPPRYENFPDRDYWGDSVLDNRRHIDFGPNETVWTVADESGIFAGQIAYEAGLMTIASDLIFTTNSWIGKGDHAYILTRLIGEPADSGKVWLYYGKRFPSLWSMIWEKADFLVKALLLVLLLILWRASGRLGPDIPARPTARKAFREHIEANGRFLWRKRQQDVLVSKTQRSFLRDFERRHPGSRRLSDEERHRTLADYCDMPVEKVDNALRQARGRSHHEFTEKMQLLRALWMKL